MIVGIDFGTSTSEIAYIDQEGRPVVIPNHLGEIVTPSVVYIDENHKPVVGTPAVEKFLLEPEATVIEVKRLLGKDETVTIRGRIYTPIDIASYIVSYLVECASKYLDQPISGAVITIPAFSTDAQRRATISVGEKCGLKVERLINEPTAASLDYGIDRREDCDKVLVYDFGGGTLDVTVLELFEGVIEVEASCGNNLLGGKDIDALLIDYMVTSIKKTSKTDVTDDLNAMTRLKKAAEDCKIALSSEESFDIDLPFLSTNKKGNPIGFTHEMTRTTFDEMITELVESTSTQVNSALKDADLSRSDIDLALLVGGTTKIPFVSSFLESELGIVPKSHHDPVLSVVRGAAIEAGIIEGKYDEDALVLTDVCPYSLSAEVLRQVSMFEDEEFCDVLIKRNTTIPTTVRKIYHTAYDDQAIVGVDVYQGEGEYADDNIFLGEVRLTGIPKGKAGKEKIAVSFSYDLNGLLVVQAAVVSTGKNISVEIDTSNVAKEIDLEMWQDALGAKKYRSVINRGDTILTTLDIDEKQEEKIEEALMRLKRGLITELDDDTLDEIKDQLLDLYGEI